MNIENVINTQYLTRGTLLSAKNAFRSAEGMPSIQLQQFFTKEFFSKLSNIVKKAKYKRKELISIASFMEAKEVPKEINELFSSDEFRKLLSLIVGKELKKLGELRVIYFGHKDYTLVQEEVRKFPGIDLWVDFTSDWEEEFGGRISYRDAEKELVYFYPMENAVTIVNRKKELNFIKYVNNKAKNRKRFLIKAYFAL